MESGNEQKGFHRNEQPVSEINRDLQSSESKKNSLVGPFGDSPNKNDRQRRKLLTWLKETQQKREENNKRIFSRWLGAAEKTVSQTELTNQASPKKEPSPSKTNLDFTSKIHSIPYDAFYTMTPAVYYSYPAPPISEYWMVGPEQNGFYSNQMQRPSCPCYPYCLQNQQLPPMMSTEIPPQNPPSIGQLNPLPSEPTQVPMSKQDPLQFNLTEWYSTLEDVDNVQTPSGETISSLEPPIGPQHLDYPLMTANNSVNYSTPNLVSGASTVSSGDFS